MIVKDTYEASFYMARGALIKTISYRGMAEDESRKTYYSREYKIEMEGVKDKWVSQWRTRNAFINARDMAEARIRVKKKIKKLKLR